MAFDIPFRAAMRIQLLEMAGQVALPPAQFPPARRKIRLVETDRKYVSDSATFDDELPVHVNLAEGEFRIEKEASFGGCGQEPDGYRLSGAVADGEGSA